MRKNGQDLFLLKRFIREAIDLGKVQFAHDRIDLPPAMRKEEDTPEEEDLFRNITGYVSMKEPFDPPSLAMLRKLLDDRGSPYKKFFAPYSSGPAYRGMYAISKETIEEWIGRPMREDEAHVSEEWLKEDSNEFLKPVGKLEYGSMRDKNVLSFSTNRDEAEMFCRDHETESRGKYHVIVTAMAEDNPRRFLDLSAGVYKLKSTQTMVHEQEVLAVGPILMSSIEWMYVPE